MSTISALILERGAASLEEVEAAIEYQRLFGGDVGNNLVAIGVMKENALHRLLSEFHQLPIGPRGQLPDYSEELEQLLPRDAARRYQVYPVKRTRRTLHLAVTAPLDAETDKRIRAAVGLQLKLVLVTKLRLAEALAHHCGLPMRGPDQRLVKMLESGVKPKRLVDDTVGKPVSHMFPATAPYRRMSEKPSGSIVPSARQPKPLPALKPSVPPSGGSSVPPPDTLDGVGAAKAQTPPSSGVPSTVDDRGPRKKRITQPYDEETGEALPPSTEGVEGEEGEDGEKKRDTQPWRDDENENGDDPPVSLRGEFTKSLSEAPPSDEAKILEEHRGFRHRGPFTRAQAEVVVSNAPDVQAVLEVLVRYARQFFERSVLLTVQADLASLRLSHGLSMRLASFKVPLGQPSVFREAFETGDPVVRSLSNDGLDGEIKRDLRVGERRVAVVPLTIRERVVAIFYGDDRDDGVDRDAVADVTDFTEICALQITRIIVRRKRKADS